MPGNITTGATCAGSRGVSEVMQNTPSRSPTPDWTLKIGSFHIICSLESLFGYLGKPPRPLGDNTMLLDY